MTNLNKKISVIVPVYGTEKYLKQCIDSIVNQTYSNLEIIIVNDCTLDNSQAIIDGYVRSDSRVKSITNSKNLGLYATRLEGVKVATGDFIAFVDSDDFISVDWFRRLIERQIKTNADIVIGQHVLYMEETKQYKFEPSNQVEFEYLNGDKLRNVFFENLGLRYAWHVVWNRIYKASFWKDNIEFFKVSTRINLWEDIVFSSLIFTKIDSIASVDFVGYFYRKNQESITATESNLNSRNKIKRDLSVELKCKLEEKYHRYIDTFLKRDHDSGRFLSQLDFNLQYENLINLVNSNDFEVISFDIFDTLIQRPLYQPSDLFQILSNKYIELSGDSVLDFAVVRERSEFNARKTSKEQEITLEEIYLDIYTNYKVDENILEQLKNYETELELSICTPRYSMFEIYKLARLKNKKIFFTSDMYLSRVTIQQILNKNGYDFCDELFLSSEVKLTKHTGDIYKHILANYQCSANQVLHIGDNYHADYDMARKSGVNTFLFPKAIDVFMGWYDDANTFKHYQHITEFIRLHLGTRCMLATVAIKLFDNPFTVTVQDSNIGRNPYWLGYYQLGIFMLGLANWLHEESKNKSQINFIARDGYLAKQVYDILGNNIYTDAPKSNYLELSRSVLYRSVALDTHSFLRVCSRHFDNIRLPNEALSQMFGESGKVLEQAKISNYDDNYKLAERLFKIENNTPTLFDSNKQLAKNIKVYLDNQVIGDDACFFDVGYARRSHMILFNLCSNIKQGFFIQEDNHQVNRYYNHFSIKSFLPSVTYNWMALKSSELEYLISDYRVGTVVDFKEDNGKIYPVYKNIDASVLVEVELAHLGALDFANDFVKYFGGCWSAINFNYVNCGYFLQQFINTTTYFDSLYFKNNKFDDEFSGIANNTAQDIFKVGFSSQEPSADLLKKLVIRFKQMPRKRKIILLGRVVSQQLGIYKTIYPMYMKFKRLLSRLK